MCQFLYKIMNNLVQGCLVSWPYGWHLKTSSWLGSQDMCLRGKQSPDEVYKQEVTKLSERAMISLCGDTGLSMKLNPKATWSSQLLTLQPELYCCWSYPPPKHLLDHFQYRICFKWLIFSKEMKAQITSMDRLGQQRTNMKHVRVFMCTW